MRSLLPLTLFFISTVGCFNNKQPEKPKFKTEILDTIGVSESMKRMIREYYYSHEANSEQIWPISSIEHGVDSCEIRLRVDHSIFIGTSLFTTISYQKNGWRGAEVSGYYNSKMHIRDSICIKQVTPDCGWQKFMDTLQSFQLPMIPSQRQIKGFRDKVDDGTDYIFEIATKNSYRRIKYHDPEVYKDSINKKVTQLIRFIDRHMHLQDIGDLDWYKGPLL